jgi:hypothetical protein
MEAMSEFSSNRPFDTGAYSPLFGGDDTPPGQSLETLVLYPSSEEGAPAPEASTEDQSLAPESIPVYESRPSLTLPPPPNPLNPLLVLSPPRQNVQRSSAPAPGASEIEDQSLAPGSIPVYDPSPSLTLPPSHLISHLLVLSPPQQNVQRSSAPAPDRSGTGSWTRSVTPLRGHGASPLGSRVKK